MLRKYNFEERHVVLIAGDFNLNARNAIHPIEFVNNLNFDNLKNKEFYDEYEYLLNILAGNKDDKDKILDLLKVKKIK